MNSILVRLPIGEAIRTSILSTKWRYVQMALDPWSSIWLGAASHLPTLKMNQSCIVWRPWILWIKFSVVMLAQFTSFYASVLLFFFFFVTGVVLVILIDGLICYWEKGSSHLPFICIQNGCFMRCHLISSTIKISVIWSLVLAHWKCLWHLKVSRISQPSKLLGAGWKYLQHAPVFPVSGISRFDMLALKMMMVF